jgi:hypothetical protein
MKVLRKEEERGHGPLLRGLTGAKEKTKGLGRHPLPTFFVYSHCSMHPPSYTPQSVGRTNVGQLQEGGGHLGDILGLWRRNPDGPWG